MAATRLKRAKKEALHSDSKRRGSDGGSSERRVGEAAERVTDLQRGERVAGEWSPLRAVPWRRPLVPRITSWAPPPSLLRPASAYHAMLNPHVRAEAGAGSLASSAEGGPAGRS